MPLSHAQCRSWMCRKVVTACLLPLFISPSIMLVILECDVIVDSASRTCSCSNMPVAVGRVCVCVCVSALLNQENQGRDPAHLPVLIQQCLRFPQVCVLKSFVYYRRYTWPCMACILRCCCPPSVVGCPCQMLCNTVTSLGTLH